MIHTIGPHGSCITVLGTGPGTRRLQQVLCHGQVRHQVVHYVTVQWLGVWHSLGNQPARDVEAWSIVMQKHLNFDIIIINGNVVKPCYFKLKEDKISEDLLIKQVVATFHHFDITMVLLISMFSCMYFEIYRE